MSVVMLVNNEIIITYTRILNYRFGPAETCTALTVNVNSNETSKSTEYN